MTRIGRNIALLAFWDESPLWLGATITSLAPHVDHVIACDGRYALYHADGVFSRADQACAIVETCQAAGLGLTLHRPNHVWFGNEVEKRDYMFRLAELEAEPNVDWLMVVDADILIHQAPHDLRQQLAETEHDVAEVSVWERSDPYRNPARLEHESKVALPQDFYSKVRFMFRAIPGLSCAGAHYCYRTPDGRYLWGAPCADEPPYDQHAAPTLDLSPLMKVEHRTHYRPLQRHEDAQAYYRRRDAAGVEVRP